MDFFKMKNFRKAHKPNPEKESEDKPVPQPDQMKHETGDLSVSAKADPAPEMEGDDDYDDDEFFTKEVKNKLKELRKNSFMVLIPEESSFDCEDDEAEGETSSNEWRDMEAEGLQQWCGFESVYNLYCERMLFFDRLGAQQLKEVGCHTPCTPSPRSTSRSSSLKLTSPLRCLSLKRMEEPEEESEGLQQPVNDPYEDLETVYVAQLCLAWEALSCQYIQLSNRILYKLEASTCYSQCAQLFQQFQVLLQRFIENERFEQGSRAEIYARTRNSLPKLLQVPNVQGTKKHVTEEEDPDMVLASDLLKIMEVSILAFYVFLKMDKKKTKNVVSSLFGVQNQIATPLQLIQTSLEKKKMKLKEFKKKNKGGRNKSWPATRNEVELFFSFISVKILSRVLRMMKISKEQLLWCEEKINNLDLSEGNMNQKRHSPLLFPC